MKLALLETIGVRGLADGAYLLGDPSAPLHLAIVTGPPGAGTSTFIDAIAFAASRLSASGPLVDPAEVLRAGANVAAIRTAWFVDDDERRYGGLDGEVTRAQVNFERGGMASTDADPGLLGLMGRYDHTPDISKVVLFPARRLSDDFGPTINDFEASQRMMRLSSATSKFAGLQRALVAKANDKSSFETAQRLFAALAPSASIAGVNSLGQLEMATSAGARLSLSRLSFSERNAFVFAASVALMGLDRSIVLVDAPELGLPVGLAARWIGVLRERTPEAQWIVASRDPELLVSAGKSAVIDLGRKT